MTSPNQYWVDTGYQAWLKSLDRACGFTSKQEPSGEKTVILLGLTQNGKTTLALRLLNALQQEEVGKALRGGRAKGQSATPGPIAYKAYSEADFRTIEKSVVRIFERYRAEYERWLRSDKTERSPFESPPTIPIPSTDPSAPFRIVDMAGFDGGREGWAGVAADYWTARADYTILVIRAEYISQLAQPEGPFSDIWPRLFIRLKYSDSVLVVTTHAFEGKRDPGEEALSWEALKANRLSELHNCLAETSIDNSKLEIFPMSLGSEDLGDGGHAREYTDRSIVELRKRLSEDNLLSRISNAEVVRKDREESFERQKQSHLVTKKTNAKALQKVQAEVDRADEFLEKLLCPLPDFRATLYKVTPVTNNVRHDTYKAREPQKAYDHYAGSLASFYDKLECILKDLKKQAAIYFPPDISSVLQVDLARPVLPSTLKREFDDSFKKWDSHWYTGWLIYEYLKEESGQALQDLMEARNSELDTKVKSLAEDYKATLARVLGDAAKQLESWKVHRSKEAHELEAKIAEIGKFIVQIEANRDALPPIPDLIERLHEAFVTEWNEEMDVAGKAVDDFNQLALSYIHFRRMKEELQRVAERFEGQSEATGTI